MIKQNIRIATILLVILLIIIGIGIGIAKADTHQGLLQLQEPRAVSLHELGDAQSSLLLNSTLEALDTHRLPVLLASKVLKSDTLLGTVENVKALHQHDLDLKLLDLGV